LGGLSQTQCIHDQFSFMVWENNYPRTFQVNLGATFETDSTQQHHRWWIYESLHGFWHAKYQVFDGCNKHGKKLNLMSRLRLFTIWDIQLLSTSLVYSLDVLIPWGCTGSISYMYR
jgi:hypothetical protein